MPEILIQNADTILTMDDTRRELHGADILIRNGVIVEIGTNLQHRIGGQRAWLCRHTRAW